MLLYAIVAEEQRRDPKAGAGNLNALQWGCYSAGALLGDLSEGVLYDALGSAHRCYACLSVIWAVMAVACLLYQVKAPSSSE